MATRKGRTAVGSVPAAAEKAPAPAMAAKGGKKKAGLSEKPVNVAAPIDMEKELAMLTAKLEEVTIQKEQTEAILKEKDLQLQQSEEDRAKLQKDVAKLQKQKAKAFSPELNVELLKLVVKEDVAEGTVLSEVADKKDKKDKKDPRQPKRPPSAYVLWSQEVKSEQPKGQAETSKNLAEQWKALPEEQKAIYNEYHKASMEEYNKSMAAYEKLLEEEKMKEAALALLNEQEAQAELTKLALQFLDHAEEKDATESSRPAAKKKSKGKDPEKPKQPMSAFMYFCNDRKKTFAASAATKSTKRNVTEEAKILAEEWNNKIKDNEKARKKWDKLAAADRERYAEEMEAYKVKKQEEEEALKEESAKQEAIKLEEGLKLLKAKEARTAAPAPAVTAAPLVPAPVLGAPAAAKGKKGPSGYNLFQKHVSESILKAEPAITLGDLSKRIGQAWKDLNGEEKARWNAKAEASAPAIQPVQPIDSSADFGL